MINPRFDSFFLDALYGQWLLGLGEFEMLGMTDDAEDSFFSVKALLWVFFILATLISQVIMFNTLIAILGDTFSRIMEKRVHIAIKTRTEMYADYIYQVKLFGFNKFTNYKYLYVIRPMDEEESQEWEGAVSIIRRRIDNLKDYILSDSHKNQNLVKGMSINIETKIKEVEQKMGDKIHKQATEI